MQCFCILLHLLNTVFLIIFFTMAHLLKMKPELEIGYLICDLGSHLIPTHSDLRFDLDLV